MKKYLPCIFLFVLIFCANSYAQKYRWNVKILIDTAGQRIFQMTAQATTIENLADKTKNPRPVSNDMKDDKRANQEKRKVTLTAFITADGVEADGDYHLVLQSPNGDKTMIGEIPDPANAKLKSHKDLKGKYLDARSFVNQQIGTPPKKVTALSNKVKVKITGVVFFDKVAHGSGHAENGVELHPILSIEPAP